MRDLDQLPFFPLPDEGVAMLAPMTFLENLDIDEHGAIVMTSLLDGRIWRLGSDRTPTLICQLEGRGSSIATRPDGGWLVFGWSVDGKVSVFRVDPDGKHEIFATLPEAVFPNGVQRMPGGHYLLADSVTATIWNIHYPSGQVSIWHRDPLLGPRAGGWEPALNGIKVWNDRLYMSNSSAARLLVLPLAEGQPAGPVEIFHEGVAVDDFAFDADGTLYMTTHPMDVVLRLSQAGELSRVAGAEQGVRGCTACRFGRTDGDQTGLYVITDGGLFNPQSGGLQPAQVVRLETGVPGAPVDFI